MALPRVLPGIMMPILKDANQSDYIDRLLEKIDRENPAIASMMREFCCAYNHGDDAVMPVKKAIAMAALVYRQLESQEEADALASAINLDSD